MSLEDRLNAEDWWYFWWAWEEKIIFSVFAVLLTLALTVGAPTVAPHTARFLAAGIYLAEQRQAGQPLVFVMAHGSAVPLPPGHAH